MAFLDHVFGVVDHETAAAAATSEFLKTFGRFSVATTVADDESWTGRYLFGRRTYLELFGPDDLSESDAPEVSAGLGLSTRARGGLEVIAKRMAALGSSTRTARKTRAEGADRVPWFDLLEATDAWPSFEAWVMEFLEEPTDLELRETAFTTWLAERTEAAASRGSPPGPALTDLSLVRLSVPAKSLATTAPMLRAAGFATVSTPSLVVAKDAGTTIELHATTESTALRRVELTIASPGVEHVEAIGRSQITVRGNGRAVWDFTSS